MLPSATLKVEHRAEIVVMMLEEIRITWKIRIHWVRVACTHRANTTGCLHCSSIARGQVDILGIVFQSETSVACIALEPINIVTHVVVISFLQICRKGTVATTFARNSYTRVYRRANIGARVTGAITV